MKSKHVSILLIVGLLLGISFHAATASKDATVQMIPADFSTLAEAARPGVVNIRTVRTIQGGGPVFKHFFGEPFGKENPFEDFFGPAPKGPHRKFKQQSLGSGFILDHEGHVVTNNHVVENADQIKVRLADGKEFDAKVVGRDPNTDLALIKIKGSNGLTPLPMGDSDRLRVGSWVLAIGSPFGLEQTVTTGIVSAKGRVIGAGPYDDFIQTDASINPGNSGGPLLNMKGEVVGINTAIFSRGGGNVGVGFAIPMNMANGIIAQLRSEGEVTRGWLGVGIQNLTAELAEYYGAGDDKGALVTQVFDGDPAEKAGIKKGDIITAVDGEKVTTSRELSQAIAHSKVGERVSVTLLRDGREKQVEVIAGQVAAFSTVVDTPTIQHVVQEAVDEYSSVGPYWFVTGYEACYQEGRRALLTDTEGIFQAKALILRQSFAECKTSCSSKAGPQATDSTLVLPSVSLSSADSIFASILATRFLRLRTA